MHQIAPEDRLALVLRQHDEMREQAARERMAAAARRTTESSGVPGGRTSGWRRAWAMAAHVRHALTARHALARHGLARHGLARQGVARHGMVR